MKIIDEKGRIFKKFNLLDLAIILFIVVCGVVLYIRIMKPEIIKKKISDVYPSKEITIKVEVIAPVGMKRYITEGDIQKEIKGCYAEVKKIEVKEIKNYHQLWGDQRKYLITFRMKVLVNAKGELFFGPEPIKLGGYFRFSTPLYDIRGRIQEIEGIGSLIPPEPEEVEVKEQREVIVEVVLDNFWLAEYISIGDKEEKESCYAQVIEKGYKKLDHRNTLMVKFKVKAFVGPGRWLFFGRDMMLKPGEDFSFNTDNYILRGQVIKVEPKFSLDTR